MATGKFDKLNNTENTAEDKLRSLPYDEYFGDMELTDEQKEKRIELAKGLEAQLLFILSLVGIMAEYGEVDWTDIEIRFQNAYFSVLGSRENVSQEMSDYVIRMSHELTESTKKNMDDDYNLSTDRAMYVAENEANTLANCDEYEEAVASGKTKKTWITMRDKRVRHTHRAVDNKTIAIDDYFEVGNSIMRYPKDELGDAEEVVNCRCSIKYT